MKKKNNEKLGPFFLKRICSVRCLFLEKKRNSFLTPFFKFPFGIRSFQSLTYLYNTNIDFFFLKEQIYFQLQLTTMYIYVHIIGTQWLMSNVIILNSNDITTYFAVTRILRI